MLVDMHLHECTYSSDSKISLEEIVTTARGRGLDAVCITDHDSMGLREYAAEYSDRTGFPIFVGIEFFSLQGDITAWGMGWRQEPLRAVIIRSAFPCLTALIR